jgi:hypothetical protein
LLAADVRELAWRHIDSIVERVVPLVIKLLPPAAYVAGVEPQRLARLAVDKAIGSISSAFVDFDEERLRKSIENLARDVAAGVAKALREAAREAVEKRLRDEDELLTRLLDEQGVAIARREASAALAGLGSAEAREYPEGSVPWMIKRSHMGLLLDINKRVREGEQLDHVLGGVVVAPSWALARWLGRLSGSRVDREALQLLHRGLLSSWIAGYGDQFDYGRNLHVYAVAGRGE